MWRRLRSLCALLVLAVVASSCYSLDSSVVVNEDGSGSFAVEYIIDKNTTEASLIAGDLVAACDAVTVMQNAAPAGSVFTPLESSSQCGARVTMEFANEVELLEGMKLLSERSRFAGFGYFPDISVNRGAVDGAWNFQAQFKPPLPANLGTQADFRSEVSSGTFVVRVNLPGRQIEHNADRITGDGTMVFEINPLVDPSGQFFVQTEPGAKIIGVDESSSLPWTSIGFFVVALGALLAALAILRRSKMRRQYEGEDDDDAMISASERLGLGTSAPLPSQDGATTGIAEPSSLEAITTDELTPVVQPESGRSLFNAAAPTAGDSWPGDHGPNDASPVFDAEEEPRDPASWVTAAQPIDPQAPETAAPFQPAGIEPMAQPVGLEPMADWPGSPDPDIGTPVLDPLAPEVLAPSVPTPDLAGATLATTAASDGWPTGPLVASAAVATAPAAVVVDHGTQAPHATDAFSAGTSFQQASPSVPQTSAFGASVTGGSATGEPDAFGGMNEFGEPDAFGGTNAFGQPEAFGETVAEAPPAATPVAAATPTQADMQWDEQRNTYVVYDARRSSWMAFDDTTQSWQPIS